MQSISNQCSKYKVEIIIADDGSNYTKNAIDNYSEIINIENDSRNFYLLKNDELSHLLDDISIREQISYKGIPEIKAKTTIGKLLKWVKRYLTDKATNFLINASFIAFVCIYKC